MFECETSDLDTSGEVGGASNFGPVDAVKDLAKVGCKGDKNFRAFPTHGHEADGRFRVGLGFCGEDQVDCVGLGFPS